MKKLIYPITLLLLNTSCAPIQPSPTSTPILPTHLPTSTPIPTNTPSPMPPTAIPTSIPPTAPPTPTLEPLPGLLPEGIVVTFTKKEVCNYSGPTELPTGEYTFIMRRNPGEDTGTAYVTYLIDGKTSQDLLNHPNRHDGHYWGAALELLVNADIQDSWRNVSRNEIYGTYSLEKGEHVVYLARAPDFQWYCDSIWVK